MATLTSYKGLEVVENATGAGGEAITDDFKILADRAPFPSISNPTSGDDSADGFAAGSTWLNTTTDTMWVCVDATTGSAVWKSFYTRESTNLTLVPESDGAVKVDNLSIEGNTISATNTNGSITLDPEGTGGTVVISTQRAITATPTAGFSIKAATGGNAFWYGAAGSSGTAWGGFGFVGNDDTLARYWIGKSHTDPHLVILDPSGNVGIDTLTPSDTLHVAGTSRFEEQITLDSVNDPPTPGTGQAVLYLDEQSLKIKFSNGTVKTIADNT